MVHQRGYGTVEDVRTAGFIKVSTFEVRAGRGVTHSSRSA